MNRRLAVMMLAAVWLAAATAQPARAAKLARSVVGGGGAPVAGAAGNGMRMVGTAAQGAIGLSNGGQHELSHGYWRSGAAAVVGVAPAPGGADDGLPRELAFGPPWPNPARGRASFRLDLPKPADVRLTVHDVQGRVVDRMDARAMPAGRHSLQWDVRGRRIGSGAYFARLEVDGRRAGVRRVIVVE